MLLKSTTFGNMELRTTLPIYGEKDAEPAPKSLEERFQRWKDEKKPSKIAASFQKIEDLKEEHIEHFKKYDYLWKTNARRHLGWDMAY